MSHEADNWTPEPASEVWTYRRVRVGKGCKRLHAWLDTAHPVAQTRLE